MKLDIEIINDFQKKGFLIIKNFLDEKKVIKTRNLLIESLNKVLLKKIIEFSNSEKKIFVLDQNLTDKEKNILETFYLGIFQRNLELYKLMISDQIFSICSSLNIKDPFANSDPLAMMHTNSKKLGGIFNSTNSPWHQDWLSMQGSLNSIVIWLPLVDIDEKIGGISILEGSHKFGLIESEKDNWFANVNNGIQNLKKFNEIKPLVNAGDVVVFSSLLVHKTAEPIFKNNEIVRLTLQYRVSDFNCKIIRSNNWHYNYHHCKPISNKPPNFIP